MARNECKDCKNRSVGCHSRCNSYKAYKEETKRINEKRQLYNEKENMLYRSLERELYKNR